MTTVSSPSVTASPSSSSRTSGSKSALDYDTFLKLLITQMKSQDPTNPMDSTEYIAQLASFSEVEQSVNMNKKLDDIHASLALSNADALIGKTVETRDGTRGVVASVLVSSDGITAILKDGQKVAIDDGTKIS